MLANKAKFEKAFIGRLKAFHIHSFKSWSTKSVNCQFCFYLICHIYMYILEHHDEKTRPQIQILKKTPKTHKEFDVLQAITSLLFQI